MSPEPVPALTLVVGEEQALVDRAVSAAVRAARASDPAVVVKDVTGGELEPGTLADILAPSLFAEPVLLVVRAAQDCAKEPAAELVGYLKEGEPGTAVVVAHAGGAKGKALLADLGKVKGAVRVDAPKLTKPGDRKALVRNEFRQAGRRIDDGALDVLMDAVGTDLRELLTAAGQLMADNPGPIGEAQVSAFHRGRAEVSGFQVADRAVAGDLAGAVELARWARTVGTADVLLSSALASTLRQMGLAAGKSPAQAAVAMGMTAAQSWKAEKAVRQAQGWSRTGLSAALAAVVRLDRDVKGGAADPGFAVERALVAVCRARRMKDDPGLRWAEHGRSDARATG